MLILLAALSITACSPGRGEEETGLPDTGKTQEDAGNKREDSGDKQKLRLQKRRKTKSGSSFAALISKPGISDTDCLSFREKQRNGII